MGALAVLLFGAGLTSLPLFDPDEGRYAEIATEMLATGDLVSPHLNGVVYLEKPPLYYWLEAAAIAVLGRHEASYRLCSVLFGLAGVGLAFVLGRSMGGRRAGLLAGAILATSPLYALLARVNIIDMTLSAWLSASLVCFWLADGSPPGRKARLLYLAAFAASALAVMTKGLIGIAIPAAVIALYAIAGGDAASLRRVPWWTGGALFLIIALPWHILVAARNPGFLSFYFIGEHLKRFGTPMAGHEEPIWFLPFVVLGGMLPWTGLLPAVAVRGCPLPRRETLFLGLWTGVVVALFSLSRSKLVPYVLPACLPLAVLCGLILDRLLEERGSSASSAQDTLAAGQVASAGMAVSTLASTAFAALLIGILTAWVPHPNLEIIDDPAALRLAMIALCVSLLAGAAWLVLGPAAGYRATVVSSACLIGTLLLLAPHVLRYRSTREFAAAAGPILPEGASLLSYGFYPQSLPVYLRRSLDVANYTGELATGIARLPPGERMRRFPTEAEFGALWRSDATVYVVVDDRNLHRMREAGIDGGSRLARRNRLSLMVNRPAAAETPTAAHLPGAAPRAGGGKESG